MSEVVVLEEKKQWCANDFRAAVAGVRGDASLMLDEQSLRINKIFQTATQSGLSVSECARVLEDFMPKTPVHYSHH